jgi:hypothetical protein
MGGAASVVSSVVSVIGGPIGTAASMALTGYSFLKQQRAAKKAAQASRAAAEQQRKQEETKQRYSQVQAQRQKVEQQRQARIRSGQILAQMGSSGLGMTGTAGYIGAMGSVGTQLSRNIQDINMEQGYGESISQSNQAIAGYQQQAVEAQASGEKWQAISSLAGNIGGSFGNPFATSNQQMKGPSIGPSNIFKGGQIGPSFMTGR